jgi:CubicO group peptidase (beta-lactamase class C family)
MAVWNRRTLVSVAGAALLPRLSRAQSPDLDEFILGAMKTRFVPGLAAARIEGGRVVWSKGYGFANVERQVPMTPDSVLNIGSVTKTITATAVMQLVEQGRLDLDRDVNAVLSFPVRNPAFPATVITARQLLTHTSSIRDGAEYENSYACGDPTVPLATWVERYLGGNGGTPLSGAFAAAEPGRSWAYSNVGFGLLGALIEAASKQSFADYTTAAILQPLGMVRSHWYLAGADRGRHATPYRHVTEGDAQVSRLADPDWVPADHRPPAFVPHCLYSFPTLPDGLLRSTVHDLARFLGAYQGQGSLGTARILSPATVRQLWTPNPLPEGQRGAPPAQGLAWYQQPADGATWQHSGGDPGIATFVAIGPTGTGVAVICNSSSAVPIQVGRRMLAGAG